MTSVVINGKIYAIGGSAVVGVTFKPLPTVYIYDPAKDNWTEGEAMPTPRWGLSSSVVKGKIYSIGGTDDDKWPPVFISTVEEYTPEGWLFSVSSEGRLATMWGEIKQSR